MTSMGKRWSESKAGSAGEEVLWLAASEPPPYLVTFLRSRGLTLATRDAVQSPSPLRLLMIEASSSPAARAPSLAGRRIAVMHPDPGNADALAQALRAKGAEVVALSLNPESLQRAETLDPDAVIMEASDFSSSCWEIVRALWQHPNLRFAPIVLATPELMGSQQVSALDVHDLSFAISDVASEYTDIVTKASKVDRFSFQLESLGPSRSLRALLESGRRLRALVTCAQESIEIDVAEQIIVGAQSPAGAAPTEGLLGVHALNLFLSQRTGRVEVRATDHPAHTNVMAPLDTALHMAREAASGVRPSGVQHPFLQSFAPSQGPAAAKAKQAAAHNRTLIGVPAVKVDQNILGADKALAVPVPANANAAPKVQGAAPVSAQAPANGNGAAAKTNGVAPAAANGVVSVNAHSTQRGLAPVAVEPPAAPAKAASAPVAETPRRTLSTRPSKPRASRRPPAPAAAESASPSDVPAPAPAPVAALSTPPDSSPKRINKVRASFARGADPEAPPKILSVAPEEPGEEPTLMNAPRPSFAPASPAATPASPPPLHSARRESLIKAQENEPFAVRSRSLRPGGPDAPKPSVPPKGSSISPAVFLRKNARWIAAGLSLLAAGIWFMARTGSHGSAPSPPPPVAALAAVAPPQARASAPPAVPPAPATTAPDQAAAAVQPRSTAVGLEEPPGSAEAEPDETGPDEGHQNRRNARKASQLSKQAAELVKKKKLSSAREKYLDALRAYPKYPRALSGLSQLALKEGDAEQARTYARQLVRARPGQAAYHLLLGDAYRAGGEESKAVAAYKAAARLGSQAAKQRLAE